MHSRKIQGRYRLCCLFGLLGRKILELSGPSVLSGGYMCGLSCRTNIERWKYYLYSSSLFPRVYRTSRFMHCLYYRQVQGRQRQCCVYGLSSGLGNRSKIYTMECTVWLF